MNLQRKVRHVISERMYGRALRLLKEEDLEPAKKLARKLQARRFSGGWEIEARAFMREGHYRRAQEILEEAVNKYPTVYVFWTYMGECCSELGEFEDAITAWTINKEQGETSNYPDLNIAIVFG